MYQRFRWLPREKCECISVFAGSLARNENVVKFLLVPSHIGHYDKHADYDAHDAAVVCGDGKADEIPTIAHWLIN